MKTIDNTHYFSITEAQEFLGISRPTIQKLIDTGKIKTINLGAGKHRKLYISKSSLNQFINAS